MELRMLFFAALRERVGARDAVWEVADGMDVAGLRQEVVRRHPAAEGLVRRSSVAVNAEYALDSVVLCPGDEVALLPPVSGGVAP
ncbi:MAG: MoaD/ThiS family protein [Candidatus Latescibacterota bacterium]